MSQSQARESQVNAIRFSVVIPLYNKQDYIQRAVNSVLAQSFEDFEILVVNDGSTDQSERLVREMTDPRIKLITQPNKGLAGARNTGIRESCLPGLLPGRGR